ncbi:MAG TPA: class I SAM-dependent methyltransferase, partial [Candidatus Sulfotelmatobacter sp.]|nr:class I SAM-dependent methyltransferase [Candidatus Sulfotelmatobacter sp.]
FFQTGVSEIDQVLGDLARLGVTVEPGRALDFGCGPGRLTQALAAHFTQVDGVDISPSMIALANQHNRHPDRCRYHLNRSDSLAIFPDETFDFVYSNITLQHMEPGYAKGYLREFVRCLRPNGVVVFQIPGRQTGLRPRLKALMPEPLLEAYRRLRYHGHPAARIHGIPQAEVLALCQAEGIAVLEVQANQNTGAGWESFRYSGRRVGSAVPRA